MDPNDNQAAVVDNPPALLETNRPTGNDEPISLLSNQIMRIILAKLELTGGVETVIRSRMVSTRWLSAVDDYYKQKSSLIVNCDTKRFSKLSVVDSDNNSDPVVVNLKNADFFGKMMKQFPNIEQLKAGWSSELRLERTKIRDAATEIDSMTSLKHLELVGKFVSVLPCLSTSLSKLELISIDEHKHTLNEKDLLQMVTRLGRDCVRIDLGGTLKLDYHLLRHWHKINPDWLAGLTHFKMFLCGDSEKHAQVVRFLSERVTCLKILNITTSYKPLMVTPALVHDLSKLTHLTELELSNITMVMPELEEASARYRLTSLDSISNFNCTNLNVAGDDRHRPTSADRLIRVLSVMLPDLVNLNLQLGGSSWSSEFQTKIEQCLSRFRNLRKHDIKFI